MRLWKTTLTYDGTAFHGWQVQPGLRTVQGTLAAAIERLSGERVLPQGSGRTDAGVHALGQVASFALGAPIPGPNLHQALNRMLPPDVRLLRLEEAPEHFHARHSARRKTYAYRIFPKRGRLQTGKEAVGEETEDGICSPMLAPYVWDCPLRVKIAELERAAGFILGTHDFTSFAASGSELAMKVPAVEIAGHPETPPTMCRRIDASAWSAEGDLLVYRVTGSGFLHHMVRNLVGTFVEVASGRRRAEEIREILLARDRLAAGPTAPARGLFLVEVEY